MTEEELNRLQSHFQKVAAIQSAIRAVNECLQWAEGYDESFRVIRYNSQRDREEGIVPCIDSKALDEWVKAHLKARLARLKKALEEMPPYPGNAAE